MSRLTRKSNREYYETHIRSVGENYTYEQFLKDRPYTLHHIPSVEYETKLGKFEDLEEELGCPLEVIIEATRKDIIDRKGIRHSVLYGGLYLFSLEDDELTNIFSLKDYQKTWWLPEDEEGFKNE